MYGLVDYTKSITQHSLKYMILNRPVLENTTVGANIDVSQPSQHVDTLPLLIPLNKCNCLTEWFVYAN